jgi:hypothetical protein
MVADGDHEPGRRTLDGQLNRPFRVVIGVRHGVGDGFRDRKDHVVIELVITRLPLEHRCDELPRGSNALRDSRELAANVHLRRARLGQKLLDIGLSAEIGTSFARSTPVKPPI